MRSIKLFGFDSAPWKPHDPHSHQCSVLIRRIARAMKSLDLYKNTIITNVRYSYTHTLEDQRSNNPYISICSTGGMEELQRIVAAFKEQGVDYDIELIPLPTNGFVSAEEMKS